LSLAPFPLEDTQEATFKQLIIEGGQMYLKALNPD
jgi:SOS-response transcriptional repressor LexA